MVSTKQPDWESGCHYIKNTACVLVCMVSTKQPDWESGCHYIKNTACVLVCMVSTKQPDWDSGCHYIKNTACVLVCMGALQTLWCVHMDVWRPLLILPRVSHSVCLGLHSHANALPTAAESTETGLTHTERGVTLVSQGGRSIDCSHVWVSAAHTCMRRCGRMQTHSDTKRPYTHTRAHTHTHTHTHTHICTHALMHTHTWHDAKHVYQQWDSDISSHSIWHVVYHIGQGEFEH
jgi:hypothetical protein